MVFSLQRYRLAKPQPPFELGGRLERAGELYILTDAMGSIRLDGPAGLFAELNPGDLVSVRVVGGDESRVRCDEIRVVGANSAPDLGPARPHAVRFAAFVKRVHDFFLERGLHPVLTPTLVRCPGLEPSLEPFATEVTKGRLKTTAYLPTSPEIHLKKAMARGWTDIFEIKTCFRRGEFSSHHENEFLMLEWYRAFADLVMIEEDLRQLVATLAAEGWVSGGEDSEIAGPAANGAGRRSSASPPSIQVTDFARLFREILKFELAPRTTQQELRELCDRLSLYNAADDSFNDLFHRLLIDRIEPHLALQGPTIVRRFPPSQAALAKLDENGWADRFEFYWRGLEIANAFNEVVDPDEQLRRWEQEQVERRRLGTSPLPIDEEMIEALRRGIPPSGGIALGMERLYMACAGVRDIQELRLFSAESLFKP